MKGIHKKVIVLGLTILLVVSVALVSLLGCAPAKEIVWRMDTAVTSTHFIYQKVYIPFLDELNARCAPGFKIVGYPGGSSGVKTEEQLRALKGNVVDMSLMAPANNVGDEPLFQVMSLPTLCRSPFEAAEAFRATSDVWEEQFEPKWDVKVLWTASWDETVIYTIPPITKLEDVKGMKVRSYSFLLNQFFEGFGSQPVSVPYLEVYSAFERGVMDAALCGSGSGLALNLADVCSTGLTELGLEFSPLWMTVSGPSWRALPEEYQNVLLDMAPAYGTLHRRVVAETMEGNYDKLRALGMTILKATPEEKELAQRVARDYVWSIFLEEQGDLGRQMLDKIQASLGR